MKVRFQADADFNHLIVKAALRREPSIDFQSAVQGGLPDLDDRNVLARSAQMGRVLVSHDYKTCLLYTSYADDDLPSVALGARRNLTTEEHQMMS